MEYYSADFIMDIVLNDKSKETKWKAEGYFIFDECGLVEIKFDARGTAFYLYVIFTEGGYYALDINQDICFPVVPYDLRWTTERAFKAYSSRIDAISASHAIVKCFEAYAKRGKNEGIKIL